MLSVVGPYRRTAPPYFPYCAARRCIRSEHAPYPDAHGVPACALLPETLRLQAEPGSDFVRQQSALFQLSDSFCIFGFCRRGVSPHFDNLWECPLRKECLSVGIPALYASSGGVRKNLLSTRSFVPQSGRRKVSCDRIGALQHIFPPLPLWGHGGFHSLLFCLCAVVRPPFPESQYACP